MEERKAELNGVWVTEEDSPSQSRDVDDIAVEIRVVALVHPQLRLHRVIGYRALFPHLYPHHPHYSPRFPHPTLFVTSPPE